MSEQVPSWLQPLFDLLEQRSVSWSMPTPHTAAATTSAPAELSLIVYGPVSSVLDVIGEVCHDEPAIRVAHWLVRDEQRARVVLVRVVDGQTTDHAILKVRDSEVVPNSRTRRRGRRRSVPNGGVNVAIYGPDGVGKSSVAAALAASLRSLGVPAPAVRTYHAFVDTDEITVRAESTGTAVKASAYGRSAHPRLRAAVLVVAYVKRLLLLLLEIRPWIRAGGLAVHDRYLLDVFLKSQKTQPDPMPVLESLLPRFAPSEDLVFVLRAEPEVVSARTCELEPAEVAAAYRLLDRCLVRVPSGFGDVDAALQASEVLRQVLRQYLQAQTQRFLDLHRRSRIHDDTDVDEGAIAHRSAPTTAAKVHSAARTARHRTARTCASLLLRVPVKWMPLDARLKLHFDVRLQQVDPMSVTRHILNEASMINASQRAPECTAAVRQYRGLWKQVMLHPTRLTTGRFVLDGPFAAAAQPFEQHHAFEVIQCILANGDWKETEEYRILLAQIERSDFRYTKGCRTRQQLDQYFSELVKLVHSIQVEGYRPQTELQGQPGDEVRILLGPDGERIVFAGGTHRLATAQLLGVSRIPVVLKAVHKAWFDRALAIDVDDQLATAVRQAVSAFPGGASGLDA